MCSIPYLGSNPFPLGSPTDNIMIQTTKAVEKCYQEGGETWQYCKRRGSSGINIIYQEMMLLLSADNSFLDDVHAFFAQKKSPFVFYLPQGAWDSRDWAYLAILEANNPCLWNPHSSDWRDRQTGKQISVSDGTRSFIFSELWGLGCWLNITYFLNHTFLHRG